MISPLTPQTVRGAGITGLGMFVPSRVMTNHDLERIVDTTDDWIVSRTGIHERRIACDDQATSDLALVAAQQALSRANLAADALDLVIVATSTGDFGTFPATSAILQDRLGATKAGAFDVAAVCSGFAYAVDVATQYIVAGRYDNVLVVGAEVNSRFVNWGDRNTCVLFGDGAGAVVLQPCDYGTGILGGILGANGAGAKYLNIPAGGSRLPLTPELLAEKQNTVYQNGREVYRFAVEIMGEAALEALQSVGLSAEDVDLFVPHQANIRIITAAAERMKLPLEKVFINLHKYGNTSAATIPIALCEAWQEGRIQPGNIIVTVGFGGGLTWGANVIRWGNLMP